jgi:hypothetical protein
MSPEELDRIDQALRSLTGSAETPAEAWDAIQRYNAEIGRQRAAVAAARSAAGGVRPETEVELRAAAVLYADERDRLVRRFRLRS